MNAPMGKINLSPFLVLFKTSMAEGCVFLRQVARTICFKNDRSQRGENHESEIRKAQVKFEKCMSMIPRAFGDKYPKFP